MPKRKPNAVNRKITPNIDLDYSDEEQHQVKQKEIQKTNIKPKIFSIEMQRQKVLQFLGGNDMPKNFNHRDEEIKQITKYIENCLANKIKNKYKILMVTGSPGAGKTLTVSHVLARLQKEKIVSKVIKFNANIIKTVRDVQEIICKQILDMKFGNNMSTIQIIRHLEEQKIKRKYVLYIEEVEIILEQKTNIFTEDFFCLFSNSKLNLMMLGISNTIDALAKYSKSISVNLNEIKNIVFQPYAVENIVKIIKEKLQIIRERFGFNIITNDKVVNFIAAKIQNLKKGDVRIVLEFLRQLANAVLPKNADEDCDAKQQGYQVTITKAQSVFTKMKSPKNDIIMSLPHTQLMVLIAVHLFIKQSDCLYLNKKDVEKKTKWVCDSMALQYHSKVLDDGLDMLQQYCLIGRIKKANEQRITLKISLSEIQVSMEEHPAFKKFFTDN